jgi:hypothetical protein
MRLLAPRLPVHPAGYRRAPAVTIRWATPADTPDLHVLAAVDSASVPDAPQLLAFAGDELWAAFSPATGAVIADPFRPSAEVVDLLRERGRQLTVQEPRQFRLRIPRPLTQPW